MGRLHARFYHELPGAALTAVVDTDAERAQRVADEFGGKPTTDISTILDAVDAVSVAVPTMHHASVAEPLIRAGVPTLIEKPLAGTVAEAKRLASLAREYGTLVQVGHTERFNPVVRAIASMEVEPKFVEVHRISPFSFRSADIGAVFDIMIHDIDVLLHLVRDRVVQVDAVGVNVLGPHEDIANARIRFAGGCVANLTASRLALKTERKIRVFSREAYLSVDYQKKSGIAVKKDKNLDILQLAAERNAEDLSQLQAADFGSMVHIEPLLVPADANPLRDELASFLAAVRGEAADGVSAEDGVAAVELAHAICEAIGEHSWDGHDTVSE
jgi:predicted dehydrogenase